MGGVSDVFIDIDLCAFKCVTDYLCLLVIDYSCLWDVGLHRIDRLWSFYLTIDPDDLPLYISQLCRLPSSPYSLVPMAILKQTMFARWKRAYKKMRIHQVDEERLMDTFLM